MTETRNIILIGRTGNGKSTLANVLVNYVNKNETDFVNFEEKFKESEKSISQTKDIQIEEFEDNMTKDGTEKIKYQVIK